MLDQLVISRDQLQERTKFSGFMLSTSVVVISILTVGMIISLFSQNIALAADSLEISAVVAPVLVEPEPKEVIEQKNQNSASDQKNDSKVPMRTQNILRSEESPLTIPDKVAVTPSDFKARSLDPFEIGTKNTDPSSTGTLREKSTGAEIGTNNGKTVADNNSKVIEKDIDPPALAVKKEVEPQKMISGGVINGKAINLVTPVYSAAAKSMGIKGAVKIQVVIDEDGRVISANAVSGHPLLTNSAVTAAKRSTFTPTLLSKQKVKVTGFIVYNFT